MDNEGTDFDGKFIDDTGPNTREMTYHSKIEESLQPVALLMDELKSDETQSRVEAMRRLETISLALGAERSRTELLPFLLSCCLDEEDEILYVLAEETVKLAGDLLGGFQYTALLIPLLEELCGAEELTVRTKAIESFKSLFSINLNLEIIHGSNLKELLTAAVGTISRLAIGDWHSKRTSAAQLLSFVCGVYSSPIEIDRSEILDNFNIDTFVQEILVPLISDDTVLVRKAAVISLGEVAKYCSLSFVETKLLELLGRLASDPQDSVRLHAVESLGSFVALLKERDETRIRGLLPLFSSLVMDESWRIRFMAASTYASFSALSRDIDYLSIYISLLADPEAEVRCAAAKSLAAVASSIDAARENVITLLESVRSLSIDSSPHVRSAVALQLNELSLALGSTL